MVCKVLSVQDPRLRQESKPVEKLDKKILKIISDMEETLRTQHDPEGVGLAAPQIGVPLKIFIMRHKGVNTVILNPQILKRSKKTNDPEGPERAKRVEGQVPNENKSEPQYIMEGCLSLPHYYGPVQRAWEITLRYDSPQMINKLEKFTGFPAQIIQHEVDHLNGTLFVDRLLEQKRQLYKLEKGEWHEVELP